MTDPTGDLTESDAAADDLGPAPTAGAVLEGTPEPAPWNAEPVLDDAWPGPAGAIADAEAEAPIAAEPASVDAAIVPEPIGDAKAESIAAADGPVLDDAWPGPGGATADAGTESIAAAAGAAVPASGPQPWDASGSAPWNADAPSTTSTAPASWQTAGPPAAGTAVIPTAVPVNSVPAVFRATATRQLTVTAAVAQPVLARAALVAGFALQDQLLTSLRGQRGSKYSGAALKPEKLPIALTVTLTDTPEGSQVTTALNDRWSGVLGRSASVAAAYRLVFVSLLADFDAALAAVDPRAQFPEIECTIPSDIAGSGGPTVIGRTIDRTNRALEATPGVQRRPTPSGSVTLVIPDAYAELDWTELQAMMTAGVLIATRPGPLPERLARDVGRVVATLETAAPRAGAAPGTVRIELDAIARPVIDFLDLQAQLRGKLPLRTLHVCTTCRLEKVVNPDFQRLQQKNRKMRILTSTVGGAISTHGVSAFLLVGRLAQLKLLDPDFVCPRCQGMTAETSLVTFCPKCGDRCDDAALRTCRKCSYDLRAEVTVTPLWTTGQPPALPVWAPPAAAWPPPADSPAADPSAWPAPAPAFDPSAWPAPVAATAAAATWPSPAGDPAANWPAPAAGTAWSAPEGDPGRSPTPANDAPATWPAPAAGTAWPPPTAPDTSPASAVVPTTWPAPASAVEHGTAWPPPAATAARTTWPAPDPATATPQPATAQVHATWPQPAAAWQESAAPSTPADPPAVAPQTASGPPPGWHPDPHGRHEYRWWDGLIWSDHVSDRGLVTADPIT